jgi:hypothetical protein
MPTWFAPFPFSMNLPDSGSGQKKDQESRTDRRASESRWPSVPTQWSTPAAYSFLYLNAETCIPSTCAHWLRRPGAACDPYLITSPYCVHCMITGVDPQTHAGSSSRGGVAYESGRTHMQTLSGLHISKGCDCPYTGPEQASQCYNFRGPGHFDLMKPS